MSSRWTIRNYNTVLREVRRAHDLTLPQARAAYRIIRDRLGRPVYGADIQRHPRISRESARIAERKVRRAPPPPKREKPTPEPITVSWRAVGYLGEWEPEGEEE